MHKVLMYGWEFPPCITGGLGVACHGIVTGLIENQVDVSFVLPCVKGQLNSSKHIQFFDCRHSRGLHRELHERFIDFSHLMEIKVVDSLLFPYLTPQAYQELLMHHQTQHLSQLGQQQWSQIFDFSGGYGHNLFAEVLRYAVVAGAYAMEIQHDIIHAHEWLTVLAGIEARKISGKPLIFHVHALETDRNPDAVNSWVFDIEKYGMQQADKVIAVSQYTKDCICKYYGIAAHKIDVVHNGILPTQLNPDHFIDKQNIRNTVLFLGRVTQQKGPYHFINMAQHVLTWRQDVNFVVAGEGNLWHEMIHLVAEKRLGTHIHFTKFLDKELTKNIFTRSKVFVMPSVSEPFGIACLEAIAQQVPVVLSKQSGVAEVISHCLNADFWDICKMSEQVLTLLQYAKLSKQIAKEAYYQLTQLLWSKQTKKIVQIYEKLA